MIDDEELSNLVTQLGGSLDVAVFVVIIGVTVGELNLRSSSSPLHVRF